MGEVTALKIKTITLPGDMLVIATNFLNQLVARNYAKNTVASYRHDLEQFIGYCTQHDILLVQIVTTNVLDDFINALLQGEQVKPITARRKTATLREYFKYCKSRGLIKVLPTDGMAKIKVRNSVVIAPTENELLKVIEHIDITTPMGLRDRAMIYLMFDAGLRCSSVCSIDIFNPQNPPSNTTWPSGVVTFTNKGGDIEENPISATTLLYIKDWLAVRHNFVAKGKPPTSAMFIGHGRGRISRRGFLARVKFHGANAGMPHLHPHLFRHRRAVDVMTNLGVHHAQHLLKHANPATTMAVYGGHSSVQMRNDLRSKCALGVAV